MNRSLLLSAVVIVGIATGVLVVLPKGPEEGTRLAKRLGVKKSVNKRRGGWQKMAVDVVPNNATHTPPRVWISTVGGGGILVAVREDGQNLPPSSESAAARRPSSNSNIGLEQPQGRWSYRRAFGGCYDVPCTAKTYPALSDSTPARMEACAQSATHHAWWIDTTFDIYALQLPPFSCASQKTTADKSAYISIFGGMDHCSKPLELLNSSINFGENSSDFGCVFDHTIASVQPIATIHLPESMMYASVRSKQEQDDSQGSWTTRGTWESNEQSSTTTTTVESLCLVGDSHFGNNWGDGKLIQKVAADILDLNYSSLAFRNNFAVAGGYDAKGPFGISMKFSLENCIQWSSGGAIIYSLASHFPEGSPDELAQHVKALVESTTTGDTEQLPCIIISPTIDACHEAIPEEWPIHQRISRNSWRQAAKAEAIRKVIADSNSSKHLHFVDTFTPSAALHFGHCSKKDPIHFPRGTFYREYLSLLFSAVRDKC